MTEFVKAQNETNAGEGTELLPKIIVRDFMQYLRDKAVLRSVFPEMPVRNKTIYFTRTTGGQTAYWLKDDVNGYPVADSQMTFAEESVSIWNLMSRAYLTDDLRDDAEVSVVNILLQDAAAEMAVKEEDAFLNGDGTNNPKGILNWGSSLVTLEKGTPATSGADFDIAYISEAMTQIELNRGTADVVLMHPKHIHVLRVLKDSTGAPLLRNDTWGSPVLRDGAVGTIYGLKVYSVPRMPLDSSTYGSDEVAPIIVADSRAVRILDRKDLTVETKREPEYARTMFVFKKRVGLYVPRPEHIAVIKGVKTSV